MHTEYRIYHTGSHPLGPLNPLLPLPPPCSTLYFPPSYDEYLSSQSFSFSLSFTPPLFTCLLSSSPFFFFFLVPLIRRPIFLYPRWKEQASPSLFKFIVLLNHEATRRRGELITRPGRNLLLVVFANGGRAADDALSIVEEDRFLTLYSNFSGDKLGTRREGIQRDWRGEKEEEIHLSLFENLS